MARFSPSSKLLAGVPVVSVWPIDDDFGDRPFLDGAQNLGDERAALGGQLVGLEAEVEDEVLRRRRKRRQEVAELAPDLVLRSRTVTLVGEPLSPTSG